MLHIPPTNLLLLAAKEEPYKKAHLLTKNVEESSGKSSGEWTSKRGGGGLEDRKSNRIRQKNKRGDSKVKSNDSPDSRQGGDIRHPRPPFGGPKRVECT